MNIVQESFEILEDCMPPSKKIEKIARICYKSEDKICEGSDIQLIRDVLLARKHYAMLEHADFCFSVPYPMWRAVRYAYYWLKEENPATMGNPIRLRFSSGITCSYVSGNVRGWLEFFDLVDMVDKSLAGENGYTNPYDSGDLLERFTLHIKGYIDSLFKGILWGGVRFCGECNKCGIEHVKDFSTIPMEHRLVHQTMSVIFTVDRGVTHELVRMRDASFAQESTRYCNYGKGKFGSEISVVSLKNVGLSTDTPEYANWVHTLEEVENSYMYLVNDCKVPAQIARGVLPQNTKSTICVTANMKEWIHIFELRALDATGPAHPQMKEVMVPLLEAAKNKYEVLSNLGQSGVFSVIS